MSGIPKLQPWISFVQSLMEFMLRRMRSMVEAHGFWTYYEKCQVLKTALLKG
jgi:hypothetical protein